MNCAECRENLVAAVEGLLAPASALDCDAHLQTCDACRAEQRAILTLQRRLIARGQSASHLALAPAVMSSVRQQTTSSKGNAIMQTILRYRWGLGLGTAAAALALTLSLTLPSQRIEAAAVEVMDKGAQVVAKLKTIHLLGRLRTLPADNFSYIDANQPFYSIELWEQFEPNLKWRVEKPGRVVVMDGKSTVMLIKNGNVGAKIPSPTKGAFDTSWLLGIADLSETIKNDIQLAKEKGWSVHLSDQEAMDGHAQSVVTIIAKTDVPDNDYTKNSFLDEANTRRVYRFNAETKMLEAVQIYLLRPSGERLIFELTQIDCNAPIPADTWDLKLPANVAWAVLPEDIKPLPDNKKYASMTAEEAARDFFEACSREDWTEVGKLLSPVDDQVKDYLGGVQIVKIGKSFTSKSYGGRFVPYEIKLRGAHGVKKWNLALRNDNPAHRWQVDGGF